MFIREVVSEVGPVTQRAGCGSGGTASSPTTARDRCLSEEELAELTERVAEIVIARLQERWQA